MAIPFVRSQQRDPHALYDELQSGGVFQSALCVFLMMSCGSMTICRVVVSTLMPSVSDIELQINDNLQSVSDIELQINDNLQSDDEFQRLMLSVPVGELQRTIPSVFFFRKIARGSFYGCTRRT